jgi:hypothetical protein
VVEFQGLVGIVPERPPLSQRGLQGYSGVQPPLR